MKRYRAKSRGLQVLQGDSQTVAREQRGQQGNDVTSLRNELRINQGTREPPHPSIRVQKDNNLRGLLIVNRIEVIS
jgi:hypothetical protein